MVKVEIQYKGKGLSYVHVKGHANTAPHGQDLVCAAVSAIVIGGMNAIENIDEDFTYEMEEGDIKITSNGAISEHDETVLETVILQLKTIQASYPEAIAIKERK